MRIMVSRSTVYLEQTVSQYFTTCAILNHVQQYQQNKQLFMNFSYFFDLQDQADQIPRTITTKTQQNSTKTRFSISNKKNAKSGPFKWKTTENKKYISFLKRNIQLMNLPVEDRKKIRINVIMSHFIQSKNPEQCRSHHQKMVLKHGSIQNIIDFEAIKKSAIKNAECLGKMKDKKTVQSCQFKSEATQEPLWYQYLNIFSQEESREYRPTEELMF